jgi:hypothetical protein
MANALAKWAIARVARGLPRRAQKALLFELCATAVVLLAVSIDLLKQDVMRLAQWAKSRISCRRLFFSGIIDSRLR